MSIICEKCRHRPDFAFSSSTRDGITFCKHIIATYNPDYDNTPTSRLFFDIDTKTLFYETHVHKWHKFEKCFGFVSDEIEIEKKSSEIEFGDRW